MATSARFKVEMTPEIQQRIHDLVAKRVADFTLAEAFEPTGDPNPIFDNLKAELARERMADDLLADAADPTLSWWQRGVLRREASDLRGGVL